LNNIFDGDKFEKLLVANWNKFLDTQKLMALVLQIVRDNTNSLAIISDSQIKTKGITVTLSRFYLHNNTFTLWTEFSVPLDSKRTAEGTIEFNMSTEGNFKFVQIIGNVYC
jgi:hypothetical protein